MHAKSKSKYFCPTFFLNVDCLKRGSYDEVLWTEDGEREGEHIPKG